MPRRPAGRAVRRSANRPIEFVGSRRLDRVTRGWPTSPNVAIRGADYRRAADLDDPEV